MANEALTQILSDAKNLINTQELREKLDKAVVNGSDLTWIELVGETLPIVVESVEKGKIELSSLEKSNLASKIILPVVKDKLPFYLKPFANTIIKYAISLIVSALNKLLSQDWISKIKTTFKKEGK